jgi:hypothetical protein
MQKKTGTDNPKENLMFMKAFERLEILEIPVMKTNISEWSFQGLTMENT